MIKVVSLFSGGGGLDLGFLNAGYDIIWAIDNDPNAVATYKLNLGNHIICEDINKIPVDNIPKADVVIGGPPCQSFSLAGKRKTEDSRGQLVWKYIDIIQHVQPKAFVFENVTGLLSAKNQKKESILENLKKAFKEIGYKICQKVLNAADYGVPQKRKRVIIVGLKNSNLDFVFPQQTHCEDGIKYPKYVSVEEALSDLGNPSAIEKLNVRYLNPPQNEYQLRMRRNNGNSFTEHVIPKTSELDDYIISHVKPGGNYMDIPKDVNSKRIRRLQEKGGHTTCYGRMLANSPSYTINTYFNRPNVGCNIHYKQNRLITIREALRLQSFPDNFILKSTSKQGKNLIVGNAVPPLIAEIIANHLKKYL